MKKMTSLLLSLAVAAACTFPAPSPAKAAQATQAEIINSVSFRGKPSVNGGFIRYLKKGEKVAVLGQPNAYWFQVKDGQGVIGYISTQSKYTQVTGTAVSETAASPASAGANAVIVNSVSFRTSPSTGAQRIRYLQSGEAVTVVSQPNSYWYQVKDSDGVTGYTSTNSRYIQVTDGNAVQAPASAPLSAPESAPAVGGSVVIEKVVAAGMGYLGTPYEYGSSRSTTATFDCSDLIRQMFIDGAGLTLPADSRKQGDYVKQLGMDSKSLSQLKRGDILFFMSYKGSSASSYSSVDKETARITHAAVYLGDGQILHTYSKTSGGVRIDRIGGNHWEYRFLFGGSVIK
ncbi:C40 family peptidase [Paenibacillus tarimensis]|uniref:C40 family peptidase n=1 Tax=Paenibacillus tarimensis TaxID=416012 RepID=UPI001F1A064A|nr:SH3 domain-containing C40 family peptidase [Paenibacillus tarimensis]MCF2944986.1 SH3 domain-containing protein [Paenibacillus tarimensis]